QKTVLGASGKAARQSALHWPVSITTPPGLLGLSLYKRHDRLGSNSTAPQRQVRSNSVPHSAVGQLSPSPKNPHLALDRQVLRSSSLNRRSTNLSFGTNGCAAHVLACLS